MTQKNPKSSQLYQELVEKGRKATNMQWEIGDLAIKVLKEYWSLEEYAEDIGINYNTLQNYRRLSNLYPAARRRDSTLWTVHEVFAAQEDRFELITRQWTVREAREFIHTRKQEESERNKPKPEPKPEPKLNPEDFKPEPKPEPPINDEYRYSIVKANLAGIDNRADAANVAWGMISHPTRDMVDWSIKRINTIIDTLDMLKTAMLTNDESMDDEIANFLGK